MIEEFSNPNPEIKPSYMTDEEIIKDWEEIQDLVVWRLTEGKTAPKEMRTKRWLRFNDLIMRHEVSTALPYEEILGFMQKRAIAAQERIDKANNPKQKKK